MTTRESVAFVHSTKSSGSTDSLLASLDPWLSPDRIDLAGWTKSAPLAPWRAMAHLEATVSGAESTWIKTGSWSRATETRFLRQHARVDAVIVMQTLCAWSGLVGRVPYLIYTDRVFAEGANRPGNHRSHATAQWARREAAFLRGAEGIFVPGDSTREVLVHTYGCRSDMVHVVGAGPNAPIVHRRRPPRLRRIAFIGRQWELHGGPETLAAFRALRHDDPELELVIVGSESEELRSEDGVEVHGIVSPHRTMEIAASCDVYVRPSHQDAYPKAVIESLMCGLPVVASDFENTRRIVGGAGRTVAPGDAHELAAAIRTVAQDYPAFLARTRQRVGEPDFPGSWAPVAAAMARVMRSSLEDRCPEQREPERQS